MPLADDYLRYLRSSNLSTDKRTSAVIVAAGRGLRMGGSTPKQYLELQGKTVLWHTLRAFELSRTDEIIIVCPRGDESFVRDSIVNEGGITKVTAVVPGGAERFDSSFRGIGAASGDYILIHDGVRALVGPELIDSVIDALAENAAVCPAVPVKDTIRMADDNGISQGILNREHLRAVQTPQGFHRNTICEAYRRFYEERANGADVSDVTDDAMLVERYMGCPIAFTQGSYRNIKITTPEDLTIAKAFLE